MGLGCLLEINTTQTKVFFTSDTHFGHSNIIKYCQRPFNSAEHMDEVLINNWNEVVSPQDIVFHLGDFCFGSDKEWIKILQRLNGTKYLILGNHDLKKIANSSQIQDYFADINMQMRVVVDKQKMLLNHYPFLCFEGGYQNVWQLFGHVHSSKHSTGLDKERLVHLFPTQYDVGVDNNNYRPVSFAQVSQIITEQQANAHK
ncbi:metallophosphoesterase [Anaerobiospirillum sp. NML120448]|uniref:metallophosphoesterase n=1 Tax=Anaerobiospirillum sp. NML120448 TaxID=2932816 RepID=UPI001FF1871D|nr:metallophosphoesterase [Anaerobiospirillum sp. NML120448]MCK0513996.1 metallophosphoesterase [Anaerobiospirillum sp. NML120448]